MPDVIQHNLLFLLDSLRVTVELALVSATGGTILGLAVALVRYLRVPILDAVTRVYIELVRGTPLLVVLFISYFAIPALLGYRATAFGASCLGFILFIGAYIAEDVRAGLASVPEGTIIAGLASGLRRSQVLRLIVIPQGLRRVIPVLTSQYVRLFKFTSVASVIGVTELTGATLAVNAREFQPLPLLAALAMAYFVACYALSLIGHRFTAYEAAVIGFIAFIAAYIAEDVRSGILSVPRGQVEAALASGLSQGQTLRLVVLPQAIRRMIPALFNQFVRLLKFTSVASVIGVTELTGATLAVNAREFQPLPLLAALAMAYFVACYALSLIGRWLNRRYAIAS